MILFLQENINRNYRRDYENNFKMFYYSDVSYCDVFLLSNIVSKAADAGSVGQFGIIARLAEWQKKDVDKDRFVSTDTKNADGVIEIYLVEGDETIYTDVSQIDLSPRFKSAGIDSNRTITLVTTTPFNISGEDAHLQFEIKDQDGNKVNTKTLIGVSGDTANKCTIMLENAITFDKKYTVSHKDYGTTDIGIGQATNFADAVVYETHVRDFSIDESSGIVNKGKYLGLTEPGTVNSKGDATGLDHLIDLGITHVQLIPVYDYYTVDESKLDTPQFNWGYDPQNYNLPEGSYSTDPTKGEVRIKEFKEMVQTLHKNDIRVIMDVVYNHTGVTGDSNFNLIVPNYYYRQNAEGLYSNASGCGNETASERSMVSKFIVESVLYWVEEYHIDGFRFDLMGIHDIETMNLIREEINKIDPTIIIYGEEWIKFGVIGGIQNRQIDYSLVPYSSAPWANDPYQSVNYAEAHDNHNVMG